MLPIVNNIFSANSNSFLQVALQIFNYQYKNNSVYRQWVDALKIEVTNIKTIEQIPFLPIRFFKSHAVVCGDFNPQAVFESSGTTGSVNSKHLVKDVSVYQQSFVKGFEMFYGDVAGWCIIGLLPSYLERQNSSLVMMVDSLIKSSGHAASNFYLYEIEKLAETIATLEAAKQKTLLVGVTFALLDFAERFPMKLEHTVVMETGGMKGRKKEMIRGEVHDYLKAQFQVDNIHSEYGMTELLSQAYASGNGKFKTVPWMKALVRDEEDPLTVYTTGRGGLNIIDLANIHSCSFIATEDVGECFDDETFAVNGRIDESDIRGCSLMFA